MHLFFWNEEVQHYPSCGALYMPVVFFVVSHPQAWPQVFKGELARSSACSEVRLRSTTLLEM
eukprot:2704212-Amphidinium_carterae.1